MGDKHDPPATISASFDRQSHEMMFLIVSLMTQVFFFFDTVVLY